MEQAIFRAVACGDVELLVKLLQQNNDLIDERDENDDLPLHVAVTNNKVNCIDVLMNFGASIDALGCSSRTPLQCAFCENAQESAYALLKYGPSLIPQDSLEETVFHKVATNGDFVGLRRLIEYFFQQQKKTIHWGNDQENAQWHLAKILNRKNVLGSTALHNAAHTGNIIDSALLIIHGADPNKEDNFGYKPMHSAAHRRNTECSRFLEASSIDPDFAKRYILSLETNQPLPIPTFNNNSQQQTTSDTMSGEYSPISFG